MRGARSELARRVKALRRQHDWSQEQLAKAAKLHRNTIANVESGREDCLVGTVYDLAEAFQVDVRDLLMPLRRDAPAWLARVETHIRRALSEIEELKQIALPRAARERVESLESRLHKGLEGVQQVKLRLGRTGEGEEEATEEAKALNPR